MIWVSYVDDHKGVGNRFLRGGRGEGEHKSAKVRGDNGNPSPEIYVLYISAPLCSAEWSKQTRYSPSPLPLPYHRHHRHHHCRGASSRRAALSQLEVRNLVPMINDRVNHLLEKESPLLGGGGGSLQKQKIDPSFLYLLYAHDDVEDGGNDDDDDDGVNDSDNRDVNGSCRVQRQVRERALWITRC